MSSDLSGQPAAEFRPLEGALGVEHDGQAEGPALPGLLEDELAVPARDGGRAVEGV
jgi:hypothetical protein